MSVSAVLGPQLVAMGVAVKNPSATASFGVPKTSPYGAAQLVEVLFIEITWVSVETQGHKGKRFEYEEKGDFATSTKHFRWSSVALDRAVWLVFSVLLRGFPHRLGIGSRHVSTRIEQLRKGRMLLAMERDWFHEDTSNLIIDYVYETRGIANQLGENQPSLC
ncbi:PREDICTED: uncharacterized protein LOC103331379 [Prunus mume]|uniref:Uncharacterized protein LOC103331379 n=1 Tax=Prunus mume TaxID=102107 RepID=A0ABM1LS53_PRUMU|nr:PREDICTED: uncharacterized protein LOC103331379 [Prunus mume]